MPSSSLPSMSCSERFARIIHPSHPLCREDIIWVLSYIQKKVAQGDPALLELPKPRLLHNFQSFAELTALLLKSPRGSLEEDQRIRAQLGEAMHGLITSHDAQDTPR